MPHNNISCHTFNVILGVIKTKNSKFLNDFDLNVLKWAGLLHDIAKLGPGYHPIHPFLSAAKALEILKDLGIISLTTEEEHLQLSKILELVNSSKEDFDVGEGAVSQHRHSHEHLDQIFGILWSQHYSKRGSFVDLVFRIALFHQSHFAIIHFPF